ncbi:MAG: type II secretion system F family protein [Deltaproteobacteria bacterium]|nr:type II secretion system F family protein [Deltaproteobacteria bacterium]MBM4316970.1 type II secretion system F family protein [Deltaproteobacteria bacterium]
MILVLLSIGVTGGTTFYLSWNLFSGALENAAVDRLEQGKKAAATGLLKLTRPLFRALVMPYSQKLKLEDWRKHSKRRIISAGLEDALDVEDLLAFKIFMGLVVPLFIYIYFLVMGNPIPLWITAGIMLIGFVYPSLMVSSARKTRHEEVKLQLPFVIDLLTLSTEAGLDFIGALQKVVEKTRPGPLVNEIERMLQEIRLGTTRADAMRTLAWRIDLQEISSLIAVLVTADQMGSSLGEVLRVQADLIRTQRFTTAEKKGAAATQKLLFPLIFFIMPAVFIMIFGPVVLGFFGVK